jgi:hypothetical protein
MALRALMLDGVVIMNITDPDNPTLAGSVTDLLLDAAANITVEGNYAYVTTLNSDRFVIVDISNPASPFVTGDVNDPVNPGRPDDVAVASGYAYVGNRDGNLVAVIDITDPTSPFIADTITDATLNGNRGIVAKDGLAYIAAYTADRLTILENLQCTNPTRNEGAIIFNTAFNVMQYCDGENWRELYP